MKALQAFIKRFDELFEASQTSVKINIKLIFILIQLFEMHRAGRVNET